MPTLLQISIEANVFSIGRIEQHIGDLVLDKGWESYLTYSRGYQPGRSTAIKIGGAPEIYWHVVMTRLFDRHGLHSKNATKVLIKKIQEINPDIIHLHQIHGYYLNIILLFEFLSEYGKPVVWTFHDCWAFTGHCAHFQKVGCEKWKNQCESCPLISAYPKSLFDRSKKNYNLKKRLFTSVADLHIVTVSKWLEGLAKESFFKQCSIQTIYNGVDICVFRPCDTMHLRKKLGLEGMHVLVAAATTWSVNKGYNDYIELAGLLDKNIVLILVGLEGELSSSLPSNIIARPRTNSAMELAEYYSMADIVMNLSYAETFGLTTAEGMACGTPGIVYNATASPELIIPKTGLVVEKGDIKAVYSAVCEILNQGKEYYSEACREYAQTCFDKNIQYTKYVRLYEELLNKDQRKPPVLTF